MYGKLARMVQARSVSAVEQGDVLPPGTVFFADPVERSRREDWLDQAVDKMDDREVVFLDPDKGLIEPLERRGDVRLREYAYFDEVAKFAEHRGDRSVVIYHHLGRKEQYKDEIKDRLGRLRALPVRTVVSVLLGKSIPSDPCSSTRGASRRTSMWLRWHVGKPL